MAVARPDLRRRRQDRPEEMGVLHRRRHRRGDGDLGQRLLADRRRRRLDARHLRPGDQHGLVGHRQSGAALRLGGRRLEDERPAAGRQSLHHLGDRARSRHRQAEVLPPGAAARRLGLRQRRRRVRHARARRQEARRAPEQGRLRLRLRSRQRQGRERLAAGQEHQLRQEHRSEDRRADRPPRSHGRQGGHDLVPGDRRRHQLESAPTARRPASTTRSATNGAWT